MPLDGFKNEFSNIQKSLDVNNDNKFDAMDTKELWMEIAEIEEFLGKKIESIKFLAEKIQFKIDILKDFSVKEYTNKKEFEDMVLLSQVYELNWIINQMLVSIKLGGDIDEEVVYARTFAEMREGAENLWKMILDAENKNKRRGRS